MSQHDWDEADRFEDLRAELLNLIAMHPERYRDDFEARLLAMSTDEALAYVKLRRDADRRWWNDRLGRRDVTEDWDPTEPVPVPVAVDRDEKPGYDPRLFGWRDRPDEDVRIGCRDIA